MNLVTFARPTLRQLVSTVYWTSLVLTGVFLVGFVGSATANDFSFRWSRWEVLLFSRLAASLLLLSVFTVWVGWWDKKMFLRGILIVLLILAIAAFI
jgi:hypothetical protein